MRLLPNEQLVRGTGFRFNPFNPDEGRHYDEIRLYWEENVPSLLAPPPATERRAYGVAIPCDPHKRHADGSTMAQVLIARKEELIGLIRSDPGINDARVQRAVSRVIDGYRASQTGAGHDNG